MNTFAVVSHKKAYIYTHSRTYTSPQRDSCFALDIRAKCTTATLCSMATCESKTIRQDSNLEVTTDLMPNKQFSVNQSSNFLQHHTHTHTYTHRDRERERERERDDENSIYHINEISSSSSSSSLRTKATHKCAKLINDNNMKHIQHHTTVDALPCGKREKTWWGTTTR